METLFRQEMLDYERVEHAISYLRTHFREQPALSEIARAVHLSEYHFQRLFSRWVGISPKRFLQFVTKEHAKTLLAQSQNILEVSFETGLSGPGRLHDLFIQCEAVTPGEFKMKGENMTVEYGFHATPFGECLLGITQRGICHLAFVRNSREEELQRFLKKWRSAQVVENVDGTAKYIQRIFKAKGQAKKPLGVFLKGTNFQIKVWEALLQIPYGKVVSYADIADYIRRPKAVRAIANAVAANPVPFLIPCHRVIRKLGDFGGYQGGTARKIALLGWEAAQRGA